MKPAFIMQYTYTRSLEDAEMLAHLSAQERIVFRAPGLRWQDVERQVERLGFGDEYLVSEVNGPNGQCCKVDPMNWRSQAPPSPTEQPQQVTA